MPQLEHGHYDYSRNPHVADFGNFIHRANPDVFHPIIAQRQREAARITQELPPNTADVKKSYPELVPIPDVDQELLLTSFDNFDGMHVGIPPKESLEGWKILWGFNLKLANEPSRIYAMRELQLQGFKRPEKQNGGILDRTAESGTILQLSDLGQNVDLTSKDEQDKFPETQTEKDIFVANLINKTQTHRTELLATGPFSFVGKRVRSFIGLGAMPDINGSALALTTAAKMHMLTEVPEVGVFSDPKRQALLAKAVLQSLNSNDPLLHGRPQDEIDFILKSWRSSIMGVLEVDERKALERAEKLTEVGVNLFRVYGHTQGGDVIKTVRTLRREYPKAEIFASQITNVDTALACEYVGADAVIIGVGSGGRCTTADLSQLIPSNALLAWRLRGVLGIPVIGEGGAVDEPVISALVGMSGINGSGSIGGGVFEAPGGMFYLTRDGKTFLKPYGGEASPRTKEISHRMYPTGLPYFPEGDQSFKQLLPLHESMTQNMIEHWQRIILGAVVMGIDAGPFVIGEMQKRGNTLWKKSPTTGYLQQTH